MASLQGLQGYKQKNLRPWRVNKYHNIIQGKLPQQYRGHMQLWTVPGRDEQLTDSPQWFQWKELVKSHGRVPRQTIKHQGQSKLLQHHQWRVLGV